jgi:2-dehydro-3-deoxyglucarate aldolase/4-hydroxy-2-oxoheptanedioate aldolase
MVPRVETREQMVQVVSQLKYAPEGQRGVALGIAHDHYCPGGPSCFAEANEDLLVIALIETATALKNLEEILSVPGLDVAWMGHYDLTVSMGIPAQFEHPAFLSAMDALVEASTRHHVAPGFLPAKPTDAAHWIRKGFRMISLSSDISLLMTALHDFRQNVERALSTASNRQNSGPSVASAAEAL